MKDQPQVEIKPEVDVIAAYKEWCEIWGIPFAIVDTVRSYDDSTLFCPAGMQQYKKMFSNPVVKGLSVANVQPCIRMNDFEEIGDTTHLLHFNMIGLFSFRHLGLDTAIRFFILFVQHQLGLKISYVTIHPDKYDLWKWGYERFGIEVRKDEGCKWTDGEIGGYCTEFFIDDVEIGNIVNPMDDCIDVGFGLERLQMFVNGTKAPALEDTLKGTILAILKAGYLPGPKQQGYVLRKLIRTLYTNGHSWDHPVFIQEVERQEKLKVKYERMKGYYPDKSTAWWYDTHGIVLIDMK